MHFPSNPLTMPRACTMLGVAAGISAEQPSRHRARGYPAGRPGIQALGVGTDPEGGAARAGAGDPRDDAALLESDRLRRFACCHPKPPHATPLCSRPDIQSFQAQPVNTRRWATRSPAGLGPGYIQSIGKDPPPPFHIREHLGVSCGGTTRKAQRCTGAGGPSDIRSTGRTVDQVRGNSRSRISAMNRSMETG